jgi:Outer membrane protein beta-barrel domain
MNVAARAGAFVVLALLGAAQPARADWLFTPFAGAAFGTSTGFLDLDGAAGRRHATYGIALTLFPEGVLGVEVGSTWTPSAFTGHDLVESSRLLTGTGSLVIALPSGWSRFVRPYATIGAGVINLTSIDITGIFPIDSTRPAASVGGGAWWPITDRLGVRGDVRLLRTLSDEAANWFETWHATVGATVRF